MGKRQKVLLITSRLPYPPIGGDKLKSYNLLKILSRHYDVHLVIVTDETLDLATEQELEKFTIKTKVFTKSKYKFYLNALKFVFNKLPIQVNYYYFNDVKNYIDEISKDMAFAISTLVRTSEYLKNFKQVKYLDMVDSIGLNYQRSKENVKSFFWKIIYWIETDRLLNYERKCIANFSNTFFVNKFEAEYWSKFGKTTWIPNGVSEKLFSYNKKNKKYKNYIAFFGKMDYQPNIDAVIWFVDNVFKYLPKNIKFIIVGSKPTNRIKKLSEEYENIEVTGFIDDPYEILNSSLLIVAPMQTGGGIQNKILESMALGTINIVSSLAAKPIVGANNNEHFFVRDNPKEITKLVNNIYQNSNKYEYLKINSKTFIKEKYTWKNYENKLLDMLGASVHHSVSE
jgi:glycosyltransferase involved in cell wall biosynthesis